MKTHSIVVVAVFLAITFSACITSHSVLWNFSTEAGSEVKVRVWQDRTWLSKEIKISIDDDLIIAGKCGGDKKLEYNAEYHGKAVKASMFLNPQTHEQTVELFIDGKFVGEFVF